MMRAARSISAGACAVAVALAVALTGCTATGSPGSGAPNNGAQTGELTPTGSAGSWFDDAYAAGVAATYATSDRVCALIRGSAPAVGESTGENTDGVVVEMQDGPGYIHRVLARALSTGAVLWELQDATCSDAGILDVAGSPALPITMGVGGGRVMNLVNVMTGETAAQLPFDDIIAAGGASTIRVVGEVSAEQNDGEALDILELSQSTLVAVSGLDSGAPAIAWTVEASDRIEAVMLEDAAIGVEHLLSDTGSVIDGRTGEARSEITMPEAVSMDWLTWATDGYVLKINESDPEYAFFDLDGAEIERTTGKSQYSFTPNQATSSPTDVTFALADHISAGTVVGVDADGTPALWEGENRSNFTSGGEIELPGSILDVRGVSTNGDLIMVNDHDRMVVVDASGTHSDTDSSEVGAELFDWPLTSGTAARIWAGFIVITSSNSTQVLLSAA